jgi:hypothetical protein
MPARNFFQVVALNALQSTYLDREAPPSPGQPNGAGDPDLAKEAFKAAAHVI